MVFACTCAVVVSAALAPSPPAIAQSTEDLGALNQQVNELYQAGKYREATMVAERALALTVRRVGPHHPDFGTAVNNLAELYEAQGKYDQAEPLYKRSLAILERAIGPDHLQRED
jgi:tetratricopeptide (TPR) repeat protein